MASGVLRPGSKHSKLYVQAVRFDHKIDDMVSTFETNVVGRSASRKRVFRRLLVGGIILGISVVYFAPSFVKAEPAQFYPSSCLGGWQHIENAQGEPESVSGQTDIKSETSATLPSNILADLYCGSFSGTIPEDAVPKKATLTIYWRPQAVTENAAPTPSSDGTTTLILDNVASSTDEILNADASSTILFDNQQEPQPPSEEKIEEVPEQENTPVNESSEPEVDKTSFWIFDHAYAQEDESTPAEVTAKTNEEIVSSSTESVPSADVASSSEELAVEVEPNPEDDALFEVFYTLDGKVWKSLGLVRYAGLSQTSFEVPLVTEGDPWDSVASLQINIRRLPLLNSTDPILLDGMVLSIEHDHNPGDETSVRSDSKRLHVENLVSGSSTPLSVTTDEDQGETIVVEGRSNESLVVYNVGSNNMVLTIPLSEDPTSFTAYQFESVGHYEGIITERSDACYLKDLEECRLDAKTVDTISFDIVTSTNTPLEYRPHYSVPVRPQ